ncbi:antirestriction protein ArdA [Ochrobactrum sp. BTU1]|uniref:antirestriction protein ArdA n=1 Tax=Ochrobactrum sp. BTU1 TaxID=2840456 RepID=UPI001C04AD69|nr:antirestriction protein ArdA [Ochrobactrum sp. BTU1]
MPRIYAACLASYNNGVLHGRWIEASSDVDAMQDEINAMLRGSKYPNVTVTCPDCDGHGGIIASGCDTCRGAGEVPSAEEWAMHDSEDLPSCFGEYPGLQAIADYVEFLEDHDEHDEEDLKAIFEDYRNTDDAADAMENRFVTICASFKDYSDDCADEHISSLTADGEAPQFLVNYFDYEAFARDLKHDYNVIDVPSGVAIFHH